MDRQATRDLDSLEAAFDLDQIYNSEELFDIVEKRNERINNKKTKTRDDLKLLKVLKNMLLLKKYRSFNNKEAGMFDKWVQSCKEKDFHRSIVLRYFSFEKRAIESKIKYPDPPAVLLRKLSFTELQNLYWYITKSGSSFKNFQQIVDNLDTDYMENQKRVEAAKKLDHTLKSARGKKRTHTETTPKAKVTTKKKSPESKYQNTANESDDIIIIDSGSEAQDSDGNDEYDYDDESNKEEGDEYSIQRKSSVRTNSQVMRIHEKNSDLKAKYKSNSSLSKRQSARSTELNHAHQFFNMKEDSANKQQDQKNCKVDKSNEEEYTGSASGRKVYVVNEDEEDSNEDDFSTFGAVFSRADLLKEHMLSKQRSASSNTDYSNNSNKNDDNSNKNPELGDKNDHGQNGGYGTDGSLNSLFE